MAKKKLKLVRTRSKSVLAVDPGKSGAIVWLNSAGDFAYFQMPLDTEGLVDFKTVDEIFGDYAGADVPPVFLERAVSFGMGTKGAFNYGRVFEAVRLAIELNHLPLTMVEPGKWSKVMHQGIDSRLKAKEKSLIAVKRLFPKQFKNIPTNRKGKHHDGVIDALLIAGWALKGFGL
jgi:hypothetical protein